MKRAAGARAAAVRPVQETSNAENVVVCAPFPSASRVGYGARRSAATVLWSQQQRARHRLIPVHKWDRSHLKSAQPRADVRTQQEASTLGRSKGPRLAWVCQRHGPLGGSHDG
mgnify:CR=1 FL=1